MTQPIRIPPRTFSGAIVNETASFPLKLLFLSNREPWVAGGHLPVIVKLPTWEWSQHRGRQNPRDGKRSESSDDSVWAPGASGADGIPTTMEQHLEFSVTPSSNKLPRKRLKKKYGNIECWLYTHFSGAALSACAYMCNPIWETRLFREWPDKWQKGGS